MKGFVEPPEVLSAGVGAADAAIAVGQGSVRKVPRSSVRIPVRSRAVTRKRYVVAGSRPVSVVLPTSPAFAGEVGDQIP